MNKHKNILESLLKGSQEDTEVKSLLINNMLLLDIMFKKYPELKSVAVDLFCSYEVPRKTTGKIERLEIREASRGGEDMVLHIQKIPATAEEMHEKINELVDAVNELKAKFALPTLKPDLTDEDLRKMMRDPKYWRDKDSAIIQKVQDGFNKLYGDKN